MVGSMTKNEKHEAQTANGEQQNNATVTTNVTHGKSAKGISVGVSKYCGRNTCYVGTGV